MKIFGIFAGLVVAAVIGLFVMSYYGALSDANTQEQSIKAQYKSNQNAYSEFSQSVVEQLKISNIYADKVQDVITKAMQGRYANDNAMVKAIQEAYPANLDSSMYNKIMQKIEAGRADFRQVQDKLISMVQVYETDLNSPWKGMWMKQAGYPKIVLADYEPVISGKTRTTFETKTDTGLELN